MITIMVIVTVPIFTIIKIPVDILDGPNPTLIIFEHLQFKMVHRDKNLYICKQANSVKAKYFITSLKTLRMGLSSLATLFFCKIGFKWRSGKSDEDQVNCKKTVCVKIRLVQKVANAPPVSFWRRKLVFQSSAASPPLVASFLGSISSRHQGSWGCIQIK